MRNNLDKSNLAGISGDYVDANVIAPGISGVQKEADSLRVISLCSPNYLFSIGESHFDSPAVGGYVRRLGTMVLGVAGELPHKENCLEVLHRNLSFLPLEWVLLGKKIERLFQGRKVVDIALNAVPIEEADNYLAQVIQSFGTRSHERSFHRCVVILYQIASTTKPGSSWGCSDASASDTTNPLQCSSLRGVAPQSRAIFASELRPQRTPPALVVSSKGLTLPPQPVFASTEMFP
jgi:hypothetical protein